MARYIQFNDDIAKQFLLLYAGGMSVRKIVAKHKTMPARTTLNAWRIKHPDFGTAYDLAKEAHTEAMLDDALEIVDTAEDPKKAKVQVDFRMWLASKLNRKQYGDKVDVEVNHKIDISGVLAAADARLKHISIEHPPQIIEAEATVR